MELASEHEDMLVSDGFYSAYGSVTGGGSLLTRSQ